MTPAELPERLAAKISVDPYGCWLWTAAASGTPDHRYGVIEQDGRQVRVTRLVYSLLVDPTLDLWPGRGGGDQAIDHLCRVTLCVNPAHLERVHARTNTLRGVQGVLGEHTSPYIGVNRRYDGWTAGIRLDGRRLHLGWYPDERTAATVYDAAAVILRGEATNHLLGKVADPPTPLLLDVVSVRIRRQLADRVEACNECGRPFVTRRPDRIWCSSTCGVRARARRRRQRKTSSAPDRKVPS